jgi:uncharacterized protein (DUF885 family)
VVTRNTPFPGGLPEAARGADRSFYAIAESYLRGTLERNPSWSTAMGYHAHDGRLEDCTAAGLRSRLDFANDFRARLGAVDATRLSLSARVDHALLINDIEGTIFTLIDLRPHERDPQSYIDLLGNATLYLTLHDPDAPVWPERLAALLSRMRAIPGFLRAARENLKSPPRVITELAVQTNRGNIAFFETTVPALSDRAPAIAAEIKEESRRAAAALRDFQEWLEGDLLRASLGDWRLGKEIWTRKLRHTLQSDMTPMEIARRAREHLDATRRRMLEVARPLHDRLFPDHRHTQTGDDLTNAVVGEVLDEAAGRHPTRETIFDCVLQAVDRARRFIRRTDLIGLPPEDDNFVVEPTPGFLDGLAVAFFSPPPVLEPHLKKSYWISSVPRGGTPEEDRAIERSFFREYNEHALQGLTIHEAFPGHYVQYWHALRSPFATVYKKMFSSGTFAEGWAVLSEEQMFDAGYAEGEPENLLVHLKQSLRSSMNALLDATLHTGSMTDEETDRWALDLMQRVCFQEEAEARGKLRRAKVTATQLSTYFVGYLELRDILQEARRADGDGFSLKAFNERLLSFGTIPPRHIRELLRAGTRGLRSARPA